MVNKAFVGKVDVAILCEEGEEEMEREIKREFASKIHGKTWGKGGGLACKGN